MVTEQKTINAYIILKSRTPIKWNWFCFPFLRVRMEGETKTPYGAHRAAKRTIERLGFEAKIEILWPVFINETPSKKTSLLNKVKT